MQQKEDAGWCLLESSSGCESSNDKCCTSMFLKREGEFEGLDWLDDENSCLMTVATDFINVVHIVVEGDWSAKMTIKNAIALKKYV